MASSNVDNFIKFEIEKSFSNTLKNAILNIQQNFNYFLSFNNYSPKKRVFTVGLNHNNNLKVSQKFVFLLENKIYNHDKWFSSEPLLIVENKPDYLATCLYMVNCLQ
ncbi:MAG: hypothetical protein KDE33_16330, partial [Bacteroidetes bacterium]|nr:hypothetical protein [Bacteroidota bacterium]